MILFFQSWVPNVEISYLEQDFNFDIFRFKTFYEPGFWCPPNHQLGYQIHCESRLASEWTDLRDQYNLIKIFSLDGRFRRPISINSIIMGYDSWLN